MPGRPTWSLGVKGGVVRISIGSASEAISQAKAFINANAKWGVKRLPWWETIDPSRVPIEELKRIKSQVDAATFVVSPDVKAMI